MKKCIPVEEAIGMVLCHDMTKIIPGQFKGRAFKKGHVITEEDVPHLKDIGKEHIYVLTLDDEHVHEDEAGIRIATAASGKGIDLSEVCEGRVNFHAAHDGLLQINVEALNKINSIQDVVLSTLHTYQTVKTNQAVAGTRIIPLATDETRIKTVEEICLQNYPIVDVLPFKHFNVGVVTTGTEVYTGRIQDKFGPVIREKFEALGSSVMHQEFVSDDSEMTVAAIHKLLDSGADMIVCTGGMSVDPDDQTPASIRAAGGEVITYGSPTFPGAMFMLAWIGKIPVLGLPGCVMYHRASIFDLAVPRLLAGIEVTREDITSMGHGGYCASCKVCRYPICPFGK